MTSLMTRLESTAIMSNKRNWKEIVVNQSMGKQLYVLRIDFEQGVDNVIFWIREADIRTRA